MREYSVSVCMATYNGIKYIRDQINSILPQLCENDEFLISDDGSSDGTWEYLEELAKNYNNIRLCRGPCKGPNSNFFQLIKSAKNEIVFISDQDDIWNLKKIDEVCEVFFQNPDKSVVLHRDIIYYKQENRYESSKLQQHGILRNILKSMYSGHQMAFRSLFKEIIFYGLQDEKDTPYDIYIGAIAEKYHESIFLDKELCTHVIHGENISKPLTIAKKIKVRWNVARGVLLAKKPYIHAIYAN